MVKVQGYCPIGCGETLVLDDKGYVICNDEGCTVPAAVSIILAEPETEHVLSITDTTMNIKHPLYERMNDQLLGCTIGKSFWLDPRAASLPPGRYRFTLTLQGWKVEHLDG